ncbi:actin binding protein, partial [Elasticomyces elasticus]
MASLNLSSNGPAISKSYQTVVDASLPSGSSPTYAQWAVFSVSSPLVNVFQQDSGNKDSVLKVQSSGDGELIDLIDEFSEGKVQFGFVKVRDPNTALPKNVLIAWCGEGVPERTKGYFTSHLSAVSRVLHGYHVQVTGRSDGDLTPEGIVQKVADSSGSKYSSATDPPPVISAPKPSVASKPVFTPARTGGGGGGPGLPMNTSRPGLVNRSSNVDDDGWGPDAPPVTRTQLEKVEPAYKPTRVDMSNLVKGKQETTATLGAKNHESDDVVKGGYQPVGKVDIASIRQQAREAGGLKDDRPEPVKGSYEPVGKVDIGAIRSRMQKPSDTPLESSRSPAAPQPPSAEPTDSARLTSLPKPKVSNKVGAGPAFA